LLFPNCIFLNQLGIKHPSIEHLLFWPKFTFRVDKNELLAQAEEAGVSTELYGEKLNRIDWSILEKQIEEYYQQGLASKNVKIK
jgi:hypothetical protein